MKIIEEDKWDKERLDMDLHIVRVEEDTLFNLTMNLFAKWIEI